VKKRKTCCSNCISTWCKLLYRNYCFHA